FVVRGGRGGYTQHCNGVQGAGAMSMDAPELETFVSEVREWRDCPLEQVLVEETFPEIELVQAAQRQFNPEDPQNLWIPRFIFRAEGRPGGIDELKQRLTRAAKLEREALDEAHGRLLNAMDELSQLDRAALRARVGDTLWKQALEDHRARSRA